MIKPFIEKIYGSPGTGKTTYDIDIVKRLLSEGVDIREIAYLSFTNAASYEALRRAAVHCEDFGDKRFYFRTIHSLANWQLHVHGYESRNIVTWREEKLFCNDIGIPPPEKTDDILEGSSISPASAFFATYAYLINTFKGIESFRECPHAISLGALDYPEIHDKYEDWKQKNNYIDFNDMLAEMYAYKINIHVDHLIVDEYQDNSPLQDAIIKNLLEGKKFVYISGDDDQALYEFQGANPRLMNEFPADKVTVLGKSWRCPEEVLAPALKLISVNRNRQPKEVVSKGPGGYFNISTATEPRNIISEVRNVSSFGLDSDIMMLARTNMLVSKIGWMLVKNGLLFNYLDKKTNANYGWNTHKTELMNDVLVFPTYKREEQFNYLACREEWTKYQRGFLHYYLYNKTQIDPSNIKLKIGTIHSAKGREAETVVVFNDITQRVFESMMASEAGMESEYRCFYVAMTRAKQNLIIVDNLFNTGFQFPIKRILRESQ